MSILLKACQKCGGDIELPRNEGLPKSRWDDPTCIQCGHIIYNSDLSKPNRRKARHE